MQTTSIIEQLPSLSPATTQICLLANQPDTGVSDLVPIVEGDPGLSVKILQLANSAAFGRPGRAHTVADAIGVIGVSSCHVAAVALAMSNLLSKAPRPVVETLRGLSILTAAASRVLASGRSNAERGEAYVTGLLSYTGEMALAVIDPATCARLLASRAWRSPTHQQAVLGFEAPALAEELLERWRIPHPLPALIGCRERADGAGDPRARQLRRAVAIACHIHDGQPLAPELSIDGSELERIVADVSRDIRSAGAGLAGAGEALRSVASAQAKIVLAAMQLEDRLKLHDPDDGVDAATSLPNGHELTRFMAGSRVLNEGTDHDVGVVMFAIDIGPDPSRAGLARARAALADVLAGKIREHELLGVYRDDVLALVAPAVTAGDLDGARERFSNLIAGSDLATKHAITVDVATSQLLPDLEVGHAEVA